MGAAPERAESLRVETDQLLVDLEESEAGW